MVYEYVSREKDRGHYFVYNLKIETEGLFCIGNTRYQPPQKNRNST